MPEVYNNRPNQNAGKRAVSNVQNMYKGTSVIPSLKDVAENNSKIVFQLQSIFPFDLFPDTITIDLQKISIEVRFFFFSKQVVSIPISEIFVVECDTNLLFATLRIKDKRYELQPMQVSFLDKAAARKARRIIQGLISVYDQGLNMGGMDIEEIKLYIEKIGSTYPDSR